MKPKIPRQIFQCGSVVVTEGGDPLEDFVDYDPQCGASDDQLTEICNDIYDYLLLGTLNA